MTMNAKRHEQKQTPTRIGVMNLFVEQGATATDDITQIVPDPARGSFAFIVTGASGNQHRTLVLVRSSDYWQRRVHLALQKLGQQLDLLVCWTHDSCVPCQTMELETGLLHPALLAAHDTAKRTRITARVFVGQLLAGQPQAYETLKKLPRSTRFRYLSQVAALSKRQRGRPLKV